MAVKKFTKPQASRQRAKPNRRSASSKIYNQPFPIVAVGASAGGLKAFVSLFANMPADSGAGFVLIPLLLTENSQVDDFVVDHDFPKIGRKKMIVNARRIFRAGVGTETILLAINEAITNN